MTEIKDWIEINISDLMDGFIDKHSEKFDEFCEDKFFEWQQMVRLIDDNPIEDNEYVEHIKADKEWERLEEQPMTEQEKYGD